MLRSLAMATSVVTIACGVGVTTSALTSDPSSTAKPEAGGGTPVLSVRRAPKFLADSVASSSLRKLVTSRLAGSELEGVAERSCFVAEILAPSGAGSARPILSLQPNQPVIPASTMKILTAQAALSIIGGEEHFSTTVRSSGPAVGGIVSGDLWLVGGGDPLLETVAYTKTKRHRPGTATSLDALADQVVASGLKEVRGRMIGDDRVFDDIRVLPTWKKAYVTEGEVGPIGGLIVDDNFSVVDKKGRRTAAVDVSRNGAEAFQSLLEERGVVFGLEASGAARSDPSAATAAPNLVATAKSIPLTDVVGEMLRESDNTTAEVLLKHVGVRSGGDPATAAGAAVTGRSLAYIGVPEAVRSNVRIVDGSGLDRGNRVTCSTLVGVLRGSPIDGPMVSGFAVMGEVGTLRERLKGTAAAGHVRAKTGTLNGVSALAGLADAGDGRRIRFAMVLNGLASTGYGVTFGNELASNLVAFPESAVSPAALAPKPS